MAEKENSQKLYIKIADETQLKAWTREQDKTRQDTTLSA
jgi:hypothetical protein